MMEDGKSAGTKSFEAHGSSYRIVCQSLNEDG
jgi:hypothetical protein